MNGWTVDLSAAAQREYRQLGEGARRSALELIDDLTHEGPYLAGAIELQHNPGNWRVRFHHDHCRMVYQVSEKRKRILITRIRPRATAYEGLKD